MIAVVLSTDSPPANDYLKGQVVTIRDERQAIDMLLVKRDIAAEDVMVK